MNEEPQALGTFLVPKVNSQFCHSPPHGGAGNLQSQAPEESMEHMVQLFIRRLLLDRAQPHTLVYLARSCDLTRDLLALLESSSPKIDLFLFINSQERYCKHLVTVASITF